MKVAFRRASTHYRTKRLATCPRKSFICCCSARKMTPLLGPKPTMRLPLSRVPSLQARGSPPFSLSNHGPGPGMAAWFARVAPLHPLEEMGRIFIRVRGDLRTGTPFTRAWRRTRRRSGFARTRRRPPPVPARRSAPAARRPVVLAERALRNRHAAPGHVGVARPGLRIGEAGEFDIGLQRRIPQAHRDQGVPSHHGLEVAGDAGVAADDEAGPCRPAFRRGIACRTAPRA